MNFKTYHEKDLINKNYAIIECDAEEPVEYIASLHEQREMAEKRQKHLRKEAIKLFEKGISITDYIIVDINDARVKQCFNYEVEED